MASVSSEGHTGAERESAAAPSEEPRGAALAAAPGGVQAAVLRMQRTAGNAAVGALLGGRPTLARSAVEGVQPATEEGEEEQSQVLSGDAADALREAVESRRSETLAAAAAAPPSKAAKHNLSTLCFQPMALGGPLQAPAWGLLAHAFLSSDYEAKMGVRRNVDAYLDDSFAGPIDPRYAAFLIKMNPGMPTWKQVLLATTTMRRPDVVLHDGAGRREFEEFKPNSIPGVIAGLAKVAEIEAIMSLLSLPYVPGHTYVPSATIPIIGTSVAGIPVNFSLSAKRLAPGLVVYEFCIETDWLKVTLAAAVLAVIAAILILTRGRVRIPIPTFGPSPIPVFP